MLSLRHRRQAADIVTQVMRALADMEHVRDEGVPHVQGSVAMHDLYVALDLQGTSVTVTPLGSFRDGLATAVVNGVARALRAGGQHTSVATADPYETSRPAVYAECRPKRERLAA